MRTNFLHAKSKIQAIYLNLPFLLNQVKGWVLPPLHWIESEESLIYLNWNITIAGAYFGTKWTFRQLLKHFYDITRCLPMISWHFPFASLLCLRACRLFSIPFQYYVYVLKCDFFPPLKCVTSINVLQVNWDEMHKFWGIVNNKICLGVKLNPLSHQCNCRKNVF